MNEPQATKLVMEAPTKTDKHADGESVSKIAEAILDEIAKVGSDQANDQWYDQWGDQWSDG